MELDFIVDKVDGFKPYIYEVNNILYFAKRLNDYTNASLHVKSQIIEKEFADPVFIIDASNTAHFHVINDQIMHYEFLKIYYPNLKMILINTDIGEYKDKKYLKVFLDIIKIYELHDDQIYITNEQQKNLLFNKLIYITTSHNHALYRFIPEELKFHGLNGWGHLKEDLEFLILNARPNLLKRIKPYIKLSDSPKKIFISREREHELMRKELKKDAIRWRIPSKDEDRILRLFFENNGYTTIFAQDLSLIDQISLYHNATHIAAEKSSAFVNTIFCKPNTQIICINIDSVYQVWYDMICPLYGLNYLEIPKMSNESEKVQRPYLSFFTYDTISMLKSEYIDIL